MNGFTFPMGKPSMLVDATSLISKEWTVPANKRWLVKYATSRNATRVSNITVQPTIGAANILMYPGDHGAGTSSGYLFMKLDLVLDAGSKIKVLNAAFTAGDTVSYGIYFLELNL